MALSQLIEKLKFGEKYILANIVVMPLAKPPDCDECKLPARNKFLTLDVWESFVYRKLYDLFRKHIVEHDKDPLYQLNTEYHLMCNERPYLQMKYVFRDKHYRNTLNILFKERLTNLHETCVYVEISDQGRAIFDKVDNLGKTIQRLSREIEHSKRESSNVEPEAKKPKFSTNCLASEVEEYHPEPVKKSARNAYEEYVPVTRNGASPGIKRTYKPSKITDVGKPVSPVEPDPYTPGVIDTPSKISYTPTSSPLSKVDLRRTHTVSTVKAEKNLFGSDDDEEYDPTCSKSPTEQQTTNDSEKDMFADSEQHSICDDTDLKPISSEPSYKREVLPRSSKINVRGLLAESPEKKAQRKASKKPGLTKTEEENLNKVIQLKKVIHKKSVQKKEGSLKKQNKIEKICEVAAEVRRLSKVEVLDCINLSKEEILETFSEYKQELRDLYLRNKDHTERQWKSSSELCYFTNFANILDDEQKFAMMQRLEDEFVPEHQRGKYTEFFTSALVMEWGLRIFMERHRFASREMALERIKQQEKSYIASLSDDFMLKYH